MIKSEKKCKYKWIELEKHEAKEYDKTFVIHCNQCEEMSKFLRFVHQKNGDYACCRCGEDGETTYICLKCIKKY